ncbi:MAG: phosphate/phosphite/phosphonate ABC transporter substrate-binding protein [Pseudomonadota bacterium]
MRRAFLGWAGAAACVACPKVAFAAFPAQAASQVPLVFGLFPARDPKKMLTDWQPLFELLSKEIGRPVEGRVADETELVAGIKAGIVDIAWMGNVPALALVEEGAGAVFARILSERGEAAYSSILVASAAGPVSSLKDALRLAPTLNVAFGEKRSFSGYAVPRYYALVRSGVRQDPGLVFKTMQYGSHRQNMASVATGKVQLATSNSEEYRLLQEKDAREAAKLRVVWRSVDLPQSPLVWSARLPREMRARVSRFFWSMDASTGQLPDALKAIRLGGFQKSSNRQLIPVVDVQMFLEMELAMQGLQTQAQRKTVLADISRRSSRIEMQLKFNGGSGV